MLDSKRFSNLDDEKSQEVFDTNAEPTVEVVSLAGEDNDFSRKNDSLEPKPTR